MRTAFSDVVDLMPQSPCELRIFYALSATAGVCEEIVYRGYLMAVFGIIGGPIVAVVGSTLIFTLGHAYQPATILRVAAFGMVASLLYLLAGSVLPVIALHFVVDVTSGTIAHMTFADGSPGGEASDQPAV